MLNISNNKVSQFIDLSQYKSTQKIFAIAYHKKFKQFLMVFTVILLLILFLPWTQNITSSGNVTTLKPNQRPQTIQSQIPGRIEQWFVQEGNLVKKGDTILRISEIKSEYFDTNLAQRTSTQLSAKSASVNAYKSKMNALKNQIAALQNEKELKIVQAKNKLKQAQLKVISDSMNFEAQKINTNIANTQYSRTLKLQKEGLKSVKDVENQQNKLQETKAKLVSAENIFLTTKNEVINNELAITAIQATYADKIAKAQSNLYATQSNTFDTQVQVSKLETDLVNYNKRNSLLYVTAPQDGYINKAIISGIGETFKEGEKLVSIMPANYELAVEMYVKPIDLPLIHIGENVRVQFDGWPAIVFSGWPNVSYGTYGAKIVAIENFISENGMYRVLLKPDQNDVAWPDAIRVGSGAKTIALLENVPIWFELWRQINSFPPNFYQPKNNISQTDKK